MQPSFLRITDGDIGRLSDKQLKQALAELIRAELLRSSLSISGLIAGGHQDAGDGGADISVSWTGQPNATDFLPRPRTDFQVKATGMPRSKITGEMRPGAKGTSRATARPLFEQLARARGAYVIASNETCAPGPLKDRKDAMRDALDDVSNASAIELDFFDANKIALWASRYPGVVLLIKEMLGEGHLGWRGHSSWSAAGKSGDLGFISDDHARAIVPPNADPVSIDGCIGAIRERLASPAGYARLVGLSGMGKTRLAEALFDANIGANALNPALAIYGDVAASPSVSPFEVADRLARSNEPAVLIIDNCRLEIHRRVVEILRSGGGKASLLTIDFDIDDEQIDQTLVVKLQPSSDKLLDALLQKRAPLVGMNDRQRIVEFAQGNARIALALCASATAGTGVASLTDSELIDRLFLVERRAADGSLSRAAETAALFYSFNVEEEQTDQAELSIVAKLADQTPSSLYAFVEELLDRGLVQKRSVWRAVMPQALAIRLAERGLKKIRVSDLLKAVEAVPRLFQSMCKRIGLLHDAPKAVEIAVALLGPGSALGSPLSLTGKAFLAFENLAPLHADAALTALERDFGSDAVAELKGHPNRSNIAALLRHIAYEAEYFDRAAVLLTSLVLGEPVDEKHNATRPYLIEMFHIVLSGTLAPPSQRLAFVEALLSRRNQAIRDLGGDALRATMESGHFSSSFDFHFGAHSRSHGWEPRQRGSTREWFATFVPKVVELAVNDDPAGAEALSAFGHSMRSLIGLGLSDLVIEAADEIRRHRFWADGWRDICLALHFDRSGMPEDTVTALDALEVRLRPTTLDDRFGAYVGVDTWMEYDPKGGQEPRDLVNRGDKVAMEIGREVASDPETMERYLRQIVTARKGKVWSLGQGLYEGSTDATATWTSLKSAFVAAAPDARSDMAIRGFLNKAAIADAQRASQWLDETLSASEFAPHQTALNIAVGIDDRAIGRLRAVLKSGEVPPSTYSYLAMGRAVEDTSAESLDALLGDLVEVGRDGIDAVIDILSMRFHSDKDLKRSNAPLLVARARSLLADLPTFETRDQMRGHHLGQLARVAFAYSADEELARLIAKQIEESHSRKINNRDEHHDLLEVLLERHPFVALDALLNVDSSLHDDAEDWLRGYSDGDDGRLIPIDKVPVDKLLEWVSKEPALRGPAAAEVVKFAEKGSNGHLIWSEAANRLLSLPDAGVAVARAFFSRFRSTGWYDIGNLLVRRPLLEALLVHPNQAVRDIAPELRAHLEKWIADAEIRHRRDDESFE